HPSPPSLPYTTLFRSRTDQVDEGRRAAVHHRQLRAVHLDARVVDAEAVERAEQVLDGADARVAAAERGRQARAGHLARARRDLRSEEHTSELQSLTNL